MIQRSTEASGWPKFEVVNLSGLVRYIMQQVILLLHSAFIISKEAGQCYVSFTIRSAALQDSVIAFIKNIGKFPAVANLPVIYRHFNMSAAFFILYMHLGVYIQMAFLRLYLIAIKIFLCLISFECVFTKPVSSSSLKLKINVYTEIRRD